MKKFLTSIILAIIISGSISSTANALREYTHGGVWNHGVGKIYVWSYYYHSKKPHYSVAIGNRKSHSGYTSPGYNARASVEKKSYYKVWSTNQTYFGFY